MGLSDIAMRSVWIFGEEEGADELERAGFACLVLLVVSGLGTINECLSHQSMQSFASLYPEIHRLLLIACVCVCGVCP